MITLTYNFNDEDFYYKVDPSLIPDDLKKDIVEYYIIEEDSYDEFLPDDLKISKDDLNDKSIVEELFILIDDDDVEKYIKDNDLEFIFEDVAYDEYKENSLYIKDPYSYYGLNPNNF